MAHAAVRAQEIELEWLASGRDVVVATLIETAGSAPFEPGAELFVDGDGNVEGGVTGGCVEGAVVEEARAVLAGGPPRTVSYGISDELAGSVGLSCGGMVTIFVHSVAGAAAETVSAVLAEAVAGRPAALATLVDGPAAGGKLALLGGRTVGTLGGGALLDRNVAHAAAGLLGEGRTAIRRFGAGGEMLGDALRVHVRAFAPAPRMLIVGAIDFSAALAPIARQLGYAVTICDARAPFLRSPRFSQAAETIVGWPEEVLADLDLGPRDCVLVFSHDPKFDLPALRAALATEVGYIGALGSRRTCEERAERLRAAGVAAADLARIHAPCGLDIGGRTPAETAISVLAEVIATRGGRAGAPLTEGAGPIHPAP